MHGSIFELCFGLSHADGLYAFNGLSQPDVSFELKANSVRTTAKGERGIRFKDGTQILITYPVYYMRGDFSWIDQDITEIYSILQVYGTVIT